MAHSQLELVMLAAELADSGEWALDGSLTAAHWLAAIADVQTCTTREWIRVGRTLRTLPATAGRVHPTRDLLRQPHPHPARHPVQRSELLDIARTTQQWPTLAQQHADALVALLREGTGPATEIVLHVGGDGCTLDDGTPIPATVIERIAPTAFLRALVDDADSHPVNASSRRRHPTTRQQRVVHERDRACVDCGRHDLLHYDHVAGWEQTHRTITSELQLRCAPCHHHRHAAA